MLCTIYTLHNSQSVHKSRFITWFDFSTSLRALFSLQIADYRHKGATFHAFYWFFFHPGKGHANQTYSCSLRNPKPSPVKEGSRSNCTTFLMWSKKRSKWFEAPSSLFDRKEINTKKTLPIIPCGEKITHCSNLLKHYVGDWKNCKSQPSRFLFKKISDYVLYNWNNIQKIV